MDNNNKQRKIPLVMKFYYVNEEQFYHITKFRIRQLRQAHIGGNEVEYKCPECSQEFMKDDIPQLQRNNMMHCTMVKVERVSNTDELSKSTIFENILVSLVCACLSWLLPISSQVPAKCRRKSA